MHRSGPAQTSLSSVSRFISPASFTRTSSPSSPLAITQKNEPLIKRRITFGRNNTRGRFCFPWTHTQAGTQVGQTRARIAWFSAHLPRGSIRVTLGEFTFGGNLCFRQRRKTARVGQLSAREFHTRRVRNEGFRERGPNPARRRSFVKFPAAVL